MLLRTLLCLALAAAVCPAELLRIEHSERSDLDGGKSFGSAGPYEKIAGKAFFAVDPKLLANQIVADVELAPRNAEGKVEFSTTSSSTSPSIQPKATGPSSSKSPTAAAQASRKVSANLLLSRGYMIVWLGWQWDVPQRPGNLRAYVPFLAGVTGEVKTQFISDKPATSFNVADRDHVPYPVVKPGDLTVRDRVIGPANRHPPAPGGLSKNRTRIVMPDGFQPGRIYEMTYISENPAVAGTRPWQASATSSPSSRNGGNGVRRFSAIIAATSNALTPCGWATLRLINLTAKEEMVS